MGAGRRIRTDDLLITNHQVKSRKIRESCRGIEPGCRPNQCHGPGKAFDEWLTNRLRFDAFSCASVREPKTHRLIPKSLNMRELEGILTGYPAWIRTMNNASKGRCVTVTPRGISILYFGWPILD